MMGESDGATKRRSDEGAEGRNQIAPTAREGMGWRGPARGRKRHAEDSEISQRTRRIKPGREHANLVRRILAGCGLF